MNHVVLLGDSIFDNATYVPGELPVIEQLRKQLSPSWQATLLAVDGDVIVDVMKQTTQLPGDTSHIVISCGGNDALRYSNILQERVKSVSEALQRLTILKKEFQFNYRIMLKHVLNFSKPMSVCTVYDSVPGIEPQALTALSIFNEVILREAFAVKVPIIDLRLIFTEVTDYSALSPIEPSAVGGEKIVQAISRLLNECDSNQVRSSIYA